MKTTRTRTDWPACPVQTMTRSTKKMWRLARRATVRQRVPIDRGRGRNRCKVAFRFVLLSTHRWLFSVGFPCYQTATELIHDQTLTTHCSCDFVRQKVAPGTADVSSRSPGFDELRAYLFAPRLQQLLYPAQSGPQVMIEAPNQAPDADGDADMRSVSRGTPGSGFETSLKQPSSKQAYINRT